MKPYPIALLALFVLLAASCASPWEAPWYQQGGKRRGILPVLNKWADIQVQEIKFHDVALLGGGNYAIDMTIKIGARKKAHNGKKYWGVIDRGFTVHVFARIAGGTDGSETSGSPMMPLSFDTTGVFHFPATGEPPKDPNATYAPGKPFPAPTKPSGQLIRITPPLNPGESREIRRIAYLSSLVPSGTQLELVVRADIYNEIHPEHDGNDKTQPDYKAPDFTPLHPTNNELATPFRLP